MNNNQFLETIKKSFIRCLETHVRSNEKLVVLHGDISLDLLQRLNSDGGHYTIKSLGVGSGKEGSITGRYVDKNVDIIVYRDNTPICGIAVKFVISNYTQNSNNYFENMLGETANIRANNIPYFQIFIIPEEVPYYREDNSIGKIERINPHNLNKYEILSNDNVSLYYHSPNKTLIGIIKIAPDAYPFVSNKEQYKAFYLSNEITTTYSKQRISFGPGVVYNDWETFAEKVKFFIWSI